MLYSGAMRTVRKSVRQSVSLPYRIARRVKAMAKRRETSENHVLVELIESGLESKEAERTRFFALAERLGASTDSRERRKIKDELARITFGE
jgi:hypothetical protein